MLALRQSNPGKHILVSESSNEEYYTNRLLLLDYFQA